jgi:hypothetical protein
MEVNRMEQEHIQEELSEVNEINVKDVNEVNEHQKMQNVSTVSQSYNNSQQQLLWADRQVTSLERQLLLNNCAPAAGGKLMSNWAKVFLCALAVIIPGIGQIIGIIAGLIMVSNDSDSDRRSYGAALLTVSLIIFVMQLIFWFIFALAVGPDFYY